jgi:hypothetical protein
VCIPDNTWRAYHFHDIERLPDQHLDIEGTVNQESSVYSATDLKHTASRPSGQVLYRVRHVAARVKAEGKNGESRIFIDLEICSHIPNAAWCGNFSYRFEFRRTFLYG